jgi:hypothetical protein
MVSTTTARSLLTTNINDNTSGDVTPADIRGVFTATFDALDGAAATSTVDYNKGQIAGEIGTPSNKTYTLELSAPFPYTITALYVQTSAGTATVAIQINGTNVTGLTGIAVSTSLNGGSALSANTVTLSNKVTMIVSAVSSAADLAYALRYTRT